MSACRTVAVCLGCCASGGVALVCLCHACVPGSDTAEETIETGEMNGQRMVARVLTVVAEGGA